jgi:hypothetical protein
VDQVFTGDGGFPAACDHVGERHSNDVER